MTNPRKLITKGIADHLKAQTSPGIFPTSAGGRVFDADDTPPDADSLPEINVLFVSEVIDAAFMHQQGIRRRVMTVRVECYHTAGKSEVDDLAWEVEEALRANPDIGGMVEWCKLLNIDLYVVENQTMALFACVMTYEIIYYTHVPEAEGVTPTQVVFSFVPDIGPGNEDYYKSIEELI